MSTETGESTASINRRLDALAWKSARAEMAKGHTLQRPIRLATYYANNKGGISRTGVARLVSDGEIIPCGVCTYRLAKPAGESP